MFSSRHAPSPDGSTLPERRHERRSDAAGDGTVWYRDVPFACTLLDISANGALVDMGNYGPAVGAEVALQLLALGRFTATVVRVEDGRVGLIFEEMSAPAGGSVPPRQAAI
jgi:hypothetical protein